MRVPVDLGKSYRLINHGPTVLITATDGTHSNLMAAQWVMPVSNDPPRIAAALDASWTRHLIETSGEFVINVPPSKLVGEIYTAGTTSGQQRDKFAACNLECVPATKVNGRLIVGCIAWLECRLIRIPESLQQYDLLIAEVIAAHVDDGNFEGGFYKFKSHVMRTVHHTANGVFFMTGDLIDAKDLQKAQRPIEV